MNSTERIVALINLKIKNHNLYVQIKNNLILCVKMNKIIMANQF